MLRDELNCTPCCLVNPFFHSVLAQGLICKGPCYLYEAMSSSKWNMAGKTNPHKPFTVKAVFRSHICALPECFGKGTAAQKVNLL